jgi:predicted aldo/keto reductase-like oxidoreductase
VKVIYKPYGKTGKTVSAVGFGGLRFDISRDDAKNAEMLLYAHEKGITYFDTAPTYCDERSEIIYGLALKHMSRPSFYISTKLMPIKVDSAQDALDKIKRSLDRLNVDKIDFFHVWNLREMAQYERAMKPGMLYDGILKAKALGLVDEICFSSHMGGAQIREVLASGKFAGVLLGLNILNFPYRWDAASWAYEHGYGVAVMNPLSGGLIPKYADKLTALADEGETPVEAALRFCIGSKEISVTLNGFTEFEHIDTACRIADEADPVTDKTREALSKKISADMASVCTGCRYCLNCPKQINVAGYMQAYNKRQMFGASDAEMVEAMRFEHQFGLIISHKGRAGDCIACGACERACTQKLPIIERMKALAGWEAQLEG